MSDVPALLEKIETKDFVCPSCCEELPDHAAGCSLNAKLVEASRADQWAFVGLLLLVLLALGGCSPEEQQAGAAAEAVAAVLGGLFVLIFFFAWVWRGGREKREPPCPTCRGAGVLCGLDKKDCRDLDCEIPCPACR